MTQLTCGIGKSCQRGIILLTVSMVILLGGGCYREDALSLQTRSFLLEIRGALARFYEDTGRYPTEKEHLSALVTGHDIDGWDGPYLTELRLVDPWLTPYFYGMVHRLIYIASSGPNRKPETNRSDLQQGLSRGDDLVILIPNIDS